MKRTNGDDRAVRREVLAARAELQRLHEKIKERARIIVTADHGLIDIAGENHMPILDGDPALDLLTVPPTGDARLQFLHVR